MNTFSAFLMGEAHRHCEIKVFDWDKAAKIIRETRCKEAEAGLQEYWEWTSGCIFKDGKPYMDDCTYLALTWATPVLDVDGTTYYCYRMESEVPGWNSDTKWPESALEILGDVEVEG